MTHARLDIEAAVSVAVTRYNLVAAISAAWAKRCIRDERNEVNA